jgi:HD-GYP domain-containing protein (c-di-GMP phosphodiesterase class II)
MKKEKDSRINTGNTSIKEYFLLFLILAAFNGFHIWIFKYLENQGFIEAHPHLVINILIVYVLIIAGGVTASIALMRQKTWIRPIEKLGEAVSKIIKGDFSVRITPLRKDGKKDYIEVLFDDFNSMTEELGRINKNMQNIIDEKTEKVIKLQNSILKTMSNLVEYRDFDTGGHQERTQYGVNLLLEEIKKHGLFSDIVNSWDNSLILQSAQLHDIGKIAVSDQILKKPGPLTKEEYEEMKKHVIYALKIIERIEKDSGENELLNHAKIFAFCHHEKWDGTGYPGGLRRANIPLQGRIMAIIDVYDALVSERPYKKAFTHEKAVSMIKEGKGTQFDPVLIDLFLAISNKYK